MLTRENYTEQHIYPECKSDRIYHYYHHQNCHDHCHHQNFTSVLKVSRGIKKDLYREYCRDKSLAVSLDTGTIQFRMTVSRYGLGPFRYSLLSVEDILRLC